MKFNKIALLTALSCLSLVSTGFANTLAKPRSCPGVSQIIGAGLMEADFDNEDNVYVAGQINNYGTADMWAFVVLVPGQDATSETDALDKARAALPTLTGKPAPMFYKNKWICLYNNLQGGYRAAAVTPISMTAMTHGSLLQLGK